MVTEDTQQAEKVGLKRKLTGPPKLLLGKTRTRSIGEDRPEAKTGTVDEPAPKSSTAAAEGELTDLTETPNTDEEALSGGRVESCRGCREVSGEHGDVMYRKGNRAKWWRWFSSAVVCTRRQKRSVKECLEKNQNAEQHKQSIHEEKRRFNVMFRRVQASSNVRTRQHSRDSVHRDDEKPLPSFQRKLRRFFTRAERNRRSTVPQQSPEARMKLNEAPSSSEAEPDERTEARGSPADQGEEGFKVQNTATGLSSEAVTVMAEMSITSEDPALSPGESPKRELGGNISNTEENVMEPADGSGTTQTGIVTADLAPVGRPVKTASSEKNRGDDHLSTSPVSSKLRNEKSLQPSTNGPSIRIELVPPDNEAVEDEEEEEDCWEGRSSENQHQHHLLLLLGFNHRELQLLQTAGTLVRAALHAAVAQLRREEQDGSERVHGKPQGSSEQEQKKRS